MKRHLHHLALAIAAILLLVQVTGTARATTSCCEPSGCTGDGEHCLMVNGLSGCHTCALDNLPMHQVLSGADFGLTERASVNVSNSYRYGAINTIWRPPALRGFSPV